MKRLVILLGVVTGLLATNAHAELPSPQGRVLLTVSGLIGETNAEGLAEFDQEMLERVGLIEFSTETPWTKGKVRFAGVPLKQLLQVVATKGSVIRATAANDYAADIPIDTLVNSEAMLAMAMDGRALTLRDKGPLWIIFPWSDKPELNRIEIYNYAVWQLLSLHVE